MKKILIFILMLFTICGCSNSKTSDIVMYGDSKSVSFDNFTLSIGNYYCSGYDNYSLSVYLYVLNNSYSTKTCNINNVSLTKEDTKANYTVYYTKKVEIEAELSSLIDFRSTIPTDIEDSNYKLSFSINNTKIIFYLYDMPDELREQRTVNYYINGEVVYTEKAFVGREYEVSYIHESSDYTSYCDVWHKDSSLKNRIDGRVMVEEDINLYGILKSNFFIMTSATDNLSYVNMINHVPKSKILAIPDTYQGKEMCIGNYAINKFIGGKIYVPKTVRKIYSGNFTNIGSETIIYYEGTKEEWKALFYNSEDSTKITNRIVFNAKKSDLK
ncbi:MAG: hypothetical protein J6Y28_01920 [Acholeplasmatales bacterium]|nr:hypothetical protein [Acholeplasmatales bacterium]